MATAIITGSAGLIGADAVRLFSEKGFTVAGLDNDMRQFFFGKEASTQWSRRQLEQTVPRYQHHSIDVRDQEAVNRVFQEYNSDIEVVIHTAAQPSHDWAARDPMVDFSVNATGTLVLLEAVRKHAPKATFIFTSTNKVYGDRPNQLPLEEHETRWEIASSHPYYENGIDETMSIDQCKHSLFGVSKVAADVLVQEYGRYFGINTGVFRGGCLTGGGHSGTELHGFLSYLMRCCIESRPYSIIGYKGKQVRDNIHSRDLVNMFWHFHRNPRVGAVYNAGGGRHSHTSLREAIVLCEQICGKRMVTRYCETNRIGDHIWYISDVRRFRSDYPEWSYLYDLRAILDEIYQGWSGRGQSRTTAA